MSIGNPSHIPSVATLTFSLKLKQYSGLNLNNNTASSSSKTDLTLNKNNNSGKTVFLGVHLVMEKQYISWHIFLDDQIGLSISWECSCYKSVWSKEVDNSYFSKKQSESRSMILAKNSLYVLWFCGFKITYDSKLSPSSTDWTGRYPTRGCFWWCFFDLNLFLKTLAKSLTSSPDVVCGRPKNIVRYWCKQTIG